MVLTKYSNYSNVFSAKNVAKLLKNIRMNEFTIKLEKSKQLLFGLIYNLGPIELEILKIYIDTNLANSFIYLFMSPVRALILFDKKPDKSLRLYIDY